MNLLAKLGPISIAIALGVGSLLLTYFMQIRTDVFNDGIIRAFELKVLDANFRVRGRVDVEPAVVIAAGDEKAIKEFGLWGQWDREDMALIVDNLIQAGADVVAFDMLFADEVGIPPREAVQINESLTSSQLSSSLARAAAGEEVELAQLQKSASELEFLVAGALDGTDQLKNRFDEHSSRITQGFIIHPSKIAGLDLSNQAERLEVLEDYFISEYGLELKTRDMSDDASEGLENEVVQLKADPSLTVSGLTRVEEIEGGFDLPLPEYIEVGEYFGYFSVDPDPDGVMRALPLVYRHKDKLVPSLTLMAAAQHFGATPLIFADPSEPSGLHRVIFAAEEGATIEVPVDPAGRLLINYLGESKPLTFNENLDERGVFPYVSLADIRKGLSDDQKSLIKGKVVMVAVTAIGTFDQRVTPFTPIAPGVEVHAAALQSMISGNALVRDADIVFIEMLLALLLAVVMGIALGKLPVGAGSALTVVVSVGWVLVAHSLFTQNLWFHQVVLQMQLWATWAGMTVYGYLTQGREKAQLKKEFSTVLAPTVVDQLLKNPDLAGLGGAERNLTVMFSDIRGFTSMSEKMTPEGLTQFLNEYLTPMTDILIERQGTLDKYMGDAIMAFWGAPISQPDHAVRACLAALDMMDKLGELRARWRAEGKPEIDIGIGLNTGLMRVGFMGSERMRNYTLLGDNVNLGSRLEGINKSYRTNIIISETTFEAAQPAVFGRVVDAVRVKGKSEPVTIYELRGRGRPNDTEKAFIENWQAALERYRRQEFAQAKAAFAALVTSGDPTSQVYVERCDHYLDAPPDPGWDGVYEMKTK